MIQMYQDHTSEKIVGIEAEFEINIRVGGTQWLEGLLYLTRELELDK